MHSGITQVSAIFIFIFHHEGQLHLILFTFNYLKYYFFIYAMHFLNTIVLVSKLSNLSLEFIWKYFN